MAFHSNRICVQKAVFSNIVVGGVAGGKSSTGGKMGSEINILKKRFCAFKKF
jgi:hypothetical protein